MALNEPIVEQKPTYQKLSDLNQYKLIWDDPDTLRAAEEIVLNATPDRSKLLRIEENSICQTSLEDETPGSMPRWKRLIALDAIIRTCNLNNIDPLLLKQILFLDYRDTKQEGGSDKIRASTTLYEDSTVSIQIFYQQQYLTDNPDIFNAIDAAHEATHFSQIVKGELKTSDLPDVHESYAKVGELSLTELGTKVIKPSTLEWMVKYYGNKEVAHRSEVEAVNTSINIVKTMDYLDLSPLNESR